MRKPTKTNYPKGGVMNPFQTYDQNFQQNLNTPYAPFVSNVDTDERAQLKRDEMTGEEPIAVVLPPHLYRPEDSQTLDMISALVTVAPGATVDVIEFTAPKGMSTKFLGYLFANTDPVNMILVPTVNRKRVLPYHGTPNPNPIQSFSLRQGTFFGGLALIETTPCDLDVEPGAVIRWTAINSGGAPAQAAVRMTGYVAQSITRKNRRFGG